MGTETPFLDLYKPDPSELVNVETDLNDNWDKLDTFGSSNNGNINGINDELDDLRSQIYGGAGRSAPPFAQMSKTSTQSIPNENGTKINFASTDWESDANMVQTDRERIRVPVRGLYLVQLKFSFNNGWSPGGLRVRLNQDGNARAYGMFVGPVSGAGWGGFTGVFSGVLALIENGMITAEVWQNSGSSQTIGTDGAGTTLGILWQGKNPGP